MYIVTREELDNIIKNAALAAAKEAIKQLNPRNDDELWDADKTGKYLGLSAWTVQYKMPIVKGFPKAILLGDGPKAPKRWRAGDIKLFAKNRKR
jgi:hypothetical protein